MVNTYVVAATIDNRSENSPAFQAALTRFGCHILGRFGIPLPDCEHGIVVLVIKSEPEVADNMKQELEAIPGTSINYMQVLEEHSCGR